MPLQRTIETSEGAALRRWLAIGGVAVLVAMYVFYATLTDIVRDSAARVPRLPPSIAEVHHPEPARPFVAAEALSLPAPVRAPRYAYPASLATPASHDTPARTDTAAAAVMIEVHKCAGPEGASYTDGPCPVGEHVETLRLPGAAGAAAARL